MQKSTAFLFYFMPGIPANSPAVWLKSQQVSEGKSHLGVLPACCDRFHLLGDHQPCDWWDTASGAWKVHPLTLPYSWWRQVSVQTQAGTAGRLVQQKQSRTTWCKKAVKLWVAYAHFRWILDSSWELSYNFLGLRHQMEKCFCKNKG